jgi:hypothetical protein
VSGRFFVKKLRKKLLIPRDVATSRVKVSTFFAELFLRRSIENRENQQGPRPPHPVMPAQAGIHDFFITSAIGA